MKMHNTNQRLRTIEAMQTTDAADWQPAIRAFLRVRFGHTYIGMITLGKISRVSRTFRLRQAKMAVAPTESRLPSCRPERLIFTGLQPSGACPAISVTIINANKT